MDVRICLLLAAEAGLALVLLWSAGVLRKPAHVLCAALLLALCLLLCAAFFTGGVFAAGKLFGGMPLALLPLIAAADFALGVITCMVIRKIPGVRILFGL